MSDKEKNKTKAFVGLCRFNDAINDIFDIFRFIDISFDTKHTEPQEAKKIPRSVNLHITIYGSDGYGPTGNIDPQKEKLAALAIRAYQAAGIPFKDNGVKKGRSDLYVHALEVDIEETSLEKIDQAMRTVIPALTAVAAMQKKKDGQYDPEATPSAEDARALVAAVAQLAGVKAVVQGVRGGRTKK